MPAIITDLSAFRERKASKNDTMFFESWTDEQVVTRIAMLKHIVDGNTDLIDTTQAIPRMSFPNGYDPVNHPGDNYEAVKNEGVRRGVFVVSE